MRVARSFPAVQAAVLLASALVLAAASHTEAGVTLRSASYNVGATAKLPSGPPVSDSAVLGNATSFEDTASATAEPGVAFATSSQSTLIVVSGGAIEEISSTAQAASVLPEAGSGGANTLFEAEFEVDALTSFDIDLELAGDGVENSANFGNAEVLLLKDLSPTDFFVFFRTKGANKGDWAEFPETLTPGVYRLTAKTNAVRSQSSYSFTIRLDEHPCARPGAILGGNGPDPLEGTPGDDVICGFGGDDVIHGRGGRDLIYGGPRTLDLFAIQIPSGDDTLYGDGGPDKLFGSDGDDTLFGGAGRDKLRGGPGNDLLDGGPGRDSMFGEDGRDTIEARDQRADRIIDGGNATDRARVDAGLDPAPSVERILP